MARVKGGASAFHGILILFPFTEIDITFVKACIYAYTRGIHLAYKFLTAKNFPSEQEMEEGEGGLEWLRGGGGVGRCSKAPLHSEN